MACSLHTPLPPSACGQLEGFMSPSLTYPRGISHLSEPIRFTSSANDSSIGVILDSQGLGQGNVSGVIHNRAPPPPPRGTSSFILASFLRWVSLHQSFGMWISPAITLQNDGQPISLTGPSVSLPLAHTILQLDFTVLSHVVCSLCLLLPREPHS